jgi:hypothetical protein
MQASYMYLSVMSCWCRRGRFKTEQERKTSFYATGLLVDVSDFKLLDPIPPTPDLEPLLNFYLHLMTHQDFNTECGRHNIIVLQKGTVPKSLMYPPGDATTHSTRPSSAVLRELPGKVNECPEDFGISRTTDYLCIGPYACIQHVCRLTWLTRVVYRSWVMFVYTQDDIYPFSHTDLCNTWNTSKVRYKCKKMRHNP